MKWLAMTVLILGLLWNTSAIGQEAHSWSLRGTVVTPNQIFADGLVTISGEKIERVGPFVSQPGGAKVIETDGVIFPGLIDLHDHITWNLFPRWKPNRMFSNRYDWQALQSYKIALDAPHRQLFKEGF